MKIDHDYLMFGLTVGVRNRVAIYNHMRSFLFDSIAARGLDAKDAELFNQLTIEQQAMRLAEEVVGEVESEFSDIFDLEPTIGESQIKAMAASRLIEAIDEKRSAFLVDELCGLDWLIHDASGVAPMTPEGGLPIDGLMDHGPDRDQQRKG
jgi:hypothetical protein